MRCGDCKYFNVVDPEYGNRDETACLFYIDDVSDYKPCGLITCNNQEPKLALPTDGSGYFAALRVKADFGCVEFKAKDSPESAQ